MKSAPLSMQIRNYLKAGFGVEDIAKKTAVHEESIRFAIRKMRADGELDEIYGGKE